MCLIGEAETEESARRDFLRRDHPEDPRPEDKIVSVRRLASNVFLSRWFPEAGLIDPDVLPGKPFGYLIESCEEELLRNEYEIIASAHHHARQEVPLILPQDLDTDEQDAGLLYHIETWITNLTRRLRQAVELEMERYRVDGEGAARGTDR
jgi:hypothetical protein